MKKCIIEETPDSKKCVIEEKQASISSQVHNLQKLKNISLEAVNFFATKTKVTCLSERVFFHLHIPELPQFSRPCV